MDESNSEAESGQESDDSAHYPLDGKFKSSKDKAHILGLPEMEREQILAERASKISEKKRIQGLQQLAALKDRTAGKSKKRGATDDLDDSPRKLSRAKTKHGEALDELKRRRESRKGATRPTTERRARRRSTDSADSDRRADESDYESRPKKPVDTVGELADFQRIRVGRTNFPKICFWPNFDQLIKGCFVRIAYSQDGSGQNVYRMAQVAGKIFRHLASTHRFKH
jgi:RNA polymerase-associated protein RTF1